MHLFLIVRIAHELVINCRWQSVAATRHCITYETAVLQQFTWLCFESVIKQFVAM